MRRTAPPPTQARRRAHRARNSNRVIILALVTDLPRSHFATVSTAAEDARARAKLHHFISLQLLHL